MINLPIKQLNSRVVIYQNNTVLFERFIKHKIYLDMSDI